MHLNPELAEMPTSELLDIVKELSTEEYVELHNSVDPRTGGQLETTRPLAIGDLQQEMSPNDPTGAMYSLEVIVELYTRAGYEEMDVDGLDETLTIADVYKQLKEDPDLKVTAAESPMKSPEFAHQFSGLLASIATYIDRLNQVATGLTNIHPEVLAAIANATLEPLSDYVADERFSSPQGVDVAHDEQVIAGMIQDVVYNELAVDLEGSIDKAKASIAAAIEYYSDLKSQLEEWGPKGSRLNAAVRKLAAQIRAKAS